MPKSADPLYELIHKLDKNEKRHFHLFAGMYGKNGESPQQYVQLFDLIAAQKTYDEAAIKAKLSNKVFAKNLSAGKHFLYQLIMRCLRHYHSGDILRFRLREMWMDAYLLHKKGLINQAFKILNKAMRLAKDRGLYATYIDLSELKRTIVLNHEDKHKPVALRSLEQEDQEAHEKLGIRLDMQYLYERGFTALKDQNLNDAGWEDIFGQYKTKLAAAEANGQVFHDMLSYYLPGVQYYNYRKDNQSSYEIDEKIISYLHDVDDAIIKEAPERYFAFLTNFFNVCTSLNKPARMEQLIGFMEQVPPANREEKLHFHTETLYCKIILYILTKNYEQAIRLAPEAENILEAGSETMIATRRRAIIINLGSSFLLLGKYKEALNWFGIMYQERDYTTVPVYQYVALLSYFICQIELNQEKFLDNVDYNIAFFLRKQNIPLRNSLKPVFFGLRRYCAKRHDKPSTKPILEEIVQLTQDKLHYTPLHEWASQKLAAGK